MWLAKQVCHPESCLTTFTKIYDFAKKVRFPAGSYHRKIIQSPENINSIPSTSHPAKGYSRGVCATRKSAFTLAEVLITLGIIGVVAALTLPTLIANYQKQETISKLQKVYTVLNQAFKLSEVDNGEFEYWDVDHNDAEAYFEKYWKPYFKIAKMCTKASDCNYSATPFLTSKGIKDGTHLISPNARVAFITTDGVTLSFSLAGGDAVQEDGTVLPVKEHFLVIIDINGSNRPNQYGRDVFWVELGKKGVIPTCTGCSSDDINASCSEYGDSCFAKIVHDGWKIKDDYPW